MTLVAWNHGYLATLALWKPRFANKIFILVPEMARTSLAFISEVEDKNPSNGCVVTANKKRLHMASRGELDFENR